MSLKTNKFRRILPQVIATTAKNFIFFDIGLRLSISTIVIPALTGITNEPNRNEFLKITPWESSWIGSITYLIIPFGSALSGPITDPLGRKRSMILVNIPFAIGWFMLYRVTEVWHIFFGFMLLGLANGLSCSPTMTYVAEISEPSVRGTLIVYSNLFMAAGSITIFVLNTLMPWRSVALVCLAVPVISAIALCFVPETPRWLLSKNRSREAERSLRWLRGWVSADTIAEEFEELQQNSKRSKYCKSCIKQGIVCPHALPTLRDKLVEFKRKSTLKPFAIVIVLNVLSQFSGYSSMRPFIVQIFNAYESPMALDQVTVMLSFTAAFSQIIFLCLIHFITKRHLYFSTGFGLFVTALTISCYGFMSFPSGYNSFDRSNQSFHLANPHLAYIPVICLFLWGFFTNFGVIGVATIFQNELFPSKIRGIASGICASMSYAFGFVAKKTYYDLESTLSLPGVALLYCAITGIGLILLYFILPETEERTLEDIELHFLDNSKKLTDWKIAKSKLLQKNASADGVEISDKSFVATRNDNEIVETLILMATDLK